MGKLRAVKRADLAGVIGKRSKRQDDGVQKREVQHQAFLKEVVSRFR